MKLVMKFLPILFAIVSMGCSGGGGGGDQDALPQRNYNKLNLGDGQLASRVIGQTNLTSDSSGTTQTKLRTPIGLDLDSYGILRVTEFLNNRITTFATITANSGTGAEAVLGQTSFTSGGANGGAGAGRPSANTLYRPTAAKTIGPKLIVADSFNHRVLIYNATPTTGNPNADVVIGAQDFVTPMPGVCAANTLHFPTHVTYVNGKLIITDSGNHRVLIYDSVPAGNLPTPSLVIGQPDLVTCDATSINGATASRLYGPTSVWTDGNKFVVADRENHRVLIWNSFPTQNGQPADVVLGQPDFASNTANIGGLSATSMNLPYSVTSNPSGQLFLSEQGNNRVLIWDQFPTANQQAADRVLGQSSMNTNSAPNPPNAGSMATPGEVIFAENSLIVADSMNNRVLIFDSK
ncbi:hypothetical protein [Bdellovibrio sp. ArHS]|uniref:hypothetical protein n=1 Tax=Bdellovibrio sp. ArHS TaxID=1569284 RepID=UPI000A7D884B|nr:hypothetical protein [Bdellovibrio sp. ArHS]